MNYKKLFEKFHLYEFIKNQFSWHSVKRIDVPSNFLRLLSILEIFSSIYGSLNDFLLLYILIIRFIIILTIVIFYLSSLFIIYSF